MFKFKKVIAIAFRIYLYKVYLIRDTKVTKRTRKPTRAGNLFIVLNGVLNIGL